MAVSDAYATAAEYRALLGKEDLSEDAEIAQDLLAVSRLIDRWCARHFARDDAPTSRDFFAPAYGPVLAEAESPWRHARGEPLLEVDDLSEAPSQVLVDEDGDGTPETAVTGYTLWPPNAPAGSEPRPYQGLVLEPWSSRQVWPPGRLVRVTARFGWPAVPAAVKRATIEFTGLLRLETPRAIRRTTEAGEILEVNRRAQDVIQELVRQYGRVRL